MGVTLFKPDDKRNADKSPESSVRTHISLYLGPEDSCCEFSRESHSKSQKSPGRSPRSPGRTTSKSPGRTTSKSPGRTTSKSPGRTASRSPSSSSNKNLRQSASFNYSELQEPISEDILKELEARFGNCRKYTTFSYYSRTEDENKYFKDNLESLKKINFVRYEWWDEHEGYIVVYVIADRVVKMFPRPIMHGKLKKKKDVLNVLNNSSLLTEGYLRSTPDEQNPLSENAKDDRKDTTHDEENEINDSKIDIVLEGGDCVDVILTEELPSLDDLKKKHGEDPKVFNNETPFYPKSEEEKEFVTTPISIILTPVNKKFQTPKNYQNYLTPNNARTRQRERRFSWKV